MSPASSSVSTPSNPPVDVDASFDYLDPVSPSLECPICRAPMIHPAMPASCQHLFCHPCISRALDLSPTCPIDRAPLTLADLVPAPRVVSDLLDELRVKCSNARDGCDHVVRRDDVERHVRDECRVEQARKRGAVKGKGKATDVGRDAEAQQTWAEHERCELCQENVPTSELPSHASTCPSAPTPCPYCASLLPRSSLSSHLLTLCPLVSTPCPHAAHGCLYTGPRASLALDHLDTDCVYEPLKDYLRKQDERVWEVESENWALRRKVRGLEERLGKVEGDLEGVKVGMGEYWFAGIDEPEKEMGDRGRVGKVGGDGGAPATTPAAASSTTLPRPFTPISPARPTVSTSLAALSTRTDSLSSSVSTLSHSHHSHLQTTHHLADELATLRSVVHGMRLQMGALMMELQRANAYGGAAAGYARGGGGGGRGRMGGASASSDPEHEHEHEGGSSESFSSSSDDELFPSSSFSTMMSPVGGGGGGAGMGMGRGRGWRAAPPLPLPMGMRVVGIRGERFGGGTGWDGHPAYGPPPVGYGSSAGGGMGIGMGGRVPGGIGGGMKL
ncbi:hypothetical protein JCM5296_002661 [Sporobolomyces johnsonii]